MTCQTNKPAADEIGLFVDESGDTSLKDPCNQVFVFGCALVAGPDVKDVSERWRMLRKTVLGDTESRLHMADHSMLIRDEKQAFLLELLGKSAFARIGVSFTQSTNIDLAGPGSDIVLKATLDELLAMHADVSRYSTVSKMAFLFERSPMRDRLEALCDGLSLEAKGSTVPIRFAHMTKDELGPCGEIADCIAHTVCAVTRTAKPEKFMVDRYDAIFKPLNQAPALHRSLSGTFRVEPSGVR
jgi:Protein of unknown function (DUF3800)